MVVSPKVVSVREEAQEMTRAFKSFVGSMSCSDVANCKYQPGGDDDDVQIELDWRQDPKRSLSDLTVVIRDGETSNVYHVHKTQIAYGPRRSGYFAKMFALGGNAGAKNKSANEVYLPPRAAQMFPLLLDFIYHDKLPNLTAKLAPSLRHLSQYFDVRELFVLTSSFIQKDLSMKTAPLYCIEADMVKDTELLDTSLRVCAENFGLFGTESLLRIPPKLFKEVVCSPHLSCDSAPLSVKVAEYVRFCERDVSDELLYWITQPQIMPQIAPEEAVFFLSYVAKSTQLQREEGHLSLRNRCISACSKAWEVNLVESIRNIPPPGTSEYCGKTSDEVKLYNKLPADIRLELLESALLTAKNDLDVCREISKGRSASAFF